MKDDNTVQIKNNLVLNLTRILTAWGWNQGSFQFRTEATAFGLEHGNVNNYLTYLDTLIRSHKKDHDWKLFTPVFVQGVRNLLVAFGERKKWFDREPNEFQLFEGKDKGAPKENIFETLDYAKKAADRLEKFGKTNIRFSLIENYGEERVLRDLRKLYPNATLFVDYDSHQPDQLRDYLYDGGVTKMTVMYPIMPLVYISLEE